MKPKGILFFDSHLDIQVLMKTKTSDAIDNLRFAEKAAFLRTCIHSTVAFSLHGIPLYLLIPEGCFKSANSLYEYRFQDLNIQADDFSEARINWLLNVLKIKPIFCPPKDISLVFKKVPRHTTVIDLDVDYLEEFQPFCYTKAPRFRYLDGIISKLGTLNDFFRAVKNIRPNNIIISEIKLSQIKAPSSPFLELLDFLKKQEYTIKFESLVKSDQEAETAIKKHEEYAKMEHQTFGKEIFTESQTNQDFFNSLLQNDEPRARLIKDYFKR
jgi:hypothetical protein